MLITISDLETTGLNAEQDSVIELGAILYSIDTRNIIAQFSALLPTMISENHAENEHLILSTQVWEPDLTLFSEFLKNSHYIVGHNFRDCDSHFFGKGLLPELEQPIVDTMTDIRFPLANYRHKRFRALYELALDHRIPVWDIHRALPDCKLIADILSCYSSSQLYEFIQLSQEPKFLYLSLEEYPGSVSKQHGFRWNDPKLASKRWAGYFTEKEAERFPFNVVKAKSKT